MADETENTDNTAPDTLSASARQTRTSLNLSAFALFVFSFAAEPFKCGLMKVGMLGNSLTMQDGTVFLLLYVLVGYFFFSFLFSMLYDGTKPIWPDKLLKHANIIAAAADIVRSEVQAILKDCSAFLKEKEKEYESKDSFLLDAPDGKSSSKISFKDYTSFLKDVATHLSIADGSPTAKDRNFSPQMYDFADKLSRTKPGGFNVPPFLTDKLSDPQGNTRSMLLPMTQLHKSIKDEAERIRIIGAIKVIGFDQLAPLIFGFFVLLFSINGYFNWFGIKLAHDLNSDYSTVSECNPAATVTPSELEARRKIEIAK